MAPITDLAQLLRHMNPKLNAGTYVFCTLGPNQEVDLDDIVALVQEPQGLSVVVDEALATRLKLEPVLRCAWITLTVTSDLQAVGLTAAFASVLGDAGIGCNVVAGTNHDHIFVPVEQARAAMTALLALQERSSGPGEP